VLCIGVQRLGLGDEAGVEMIHQLCTKFAQELCRAPRRAIFAPAPACVTIRKKMRRARLRSADQITIKQTIEASKQTIASWRFLLGLIGEA
jgi:hypothetical protein